jgi:hypothetical protein
MPLQTSRARTLTSAMTATVLLGCLLGGAHAQVLTVELVGNAGVVLSDGTTALLVDLPYESGAFGYMRYDHDALRPVGNVVSVITHHHLDHFDPSLFERHASWRVIGPSSVTDALPPDRVETADSVPAGAFAVVAVPTPHTPDHRSYRIRWRGRIFHFTGDTESADAVLSERAIDVLFVTPWLQCALASSDRPGTWERAVLYHVQPDGSDRLCGTADRLAQGARFTLSPR